METSELEMTPPDSPKSTAASSYAFRLRPIGATVARQIPVLKVARSNRVSVTGRECRQVADGTPTGNYARLQALAKTLKHPEAVDAPSQSGAYPCPFRVRCPMSTNNTACKDRGTKGTMSTTYTLVGQPVPAAARRRPPPEQTETNHAANDQTNNQKAV